MPNNSGKPVDSAGNLQVDFAWGNFPPQPNDVRTDVADTNTSVSTDDPIYSASNPKKRLTPGKDNHDAIFGGWGGYPLFSTGTKDVNNQLQGDMGKFGQQFGASNANATASTTAAGTIGAYTITVVSANNIAVGQVVVSVGNLLPGTEVISISGTTITLNLPVQATMTSGSTNVYFGDFTKLSYVPYINVPSVIGETNESAKDALRDSGFANSVIQSNTVVAGGRIAVTNAVRTVTTGVVNLAATAHGFVTGDIIAVYGLPTTNNANTNNGVFTVDQTVSGAGVNVIGFTHPTLTTATTTQAAAAAYAVVVGKSVSTTGAAVATINATQATVGSNAIVLASANSLVVPGLVVSASGYIPAGTTVLSVIGTTVILSAAITAAMSAQSTAFYYPSGSTNVIVASATNITVGMTVTGTGIPSTPATTVQYINGTTLGLSAATTASIGTGALTFATNATNAFGARTVAFSATDATKGTMTVNTLTNHGLVVGDAVSVIGSTVQAASVGTVTTATTALTLADFTNVSASSTTFVTGPGITPGTYVSATVGTPITSITLSANATATLVAASAVTTGTGTAGGTTLTIPTGSGATAASLTAVGHLVTGPGIPDGTYATAAGTTSITLSNALLADPASGPITFSLAKVASGTAGSNTLTISNTSALVVGQTVTGASIPVGTIVTSITSNTSVTLSRNLLTTISSKVVTFSNLLTFGTVANSKFNSAIASSLVGYNLVSAVPSTTSFQIALTGLTGAANISTSSDNFVVTSASSTSGGVTLNVAAGVDNMLGCIVTGTGIPDNTIVTSRSTNALTISKALTADPNGAPLVFYPGTVAVGVRSNTVSAQSLTAGTAATYTTAAISGNNITLSVYN